MRSSRSLRSSLVLLVFLVVRPAADGTPLDPEIVIDLGLQSVPVSTNISIVQPTPTGADITFQFFNDTGFVVNSLMFETDINKGLTTVTTAFTCSQPGGYFLGCTITYDVKTGHLIYLFSGVTGLDGEEIDPSSPLCTKNVSCDNEQGEHEGIPLGGHFTVTLLGWTLAPTAQTPSGGTELLYSGQRTFNDSFTTVPEPSNGELVGFLLVIGILAIRYRVIRIDTDGDKAI